MNLSKVTPTTTKVTAYGGGTLPFVGTTSLKVWRGKSKYILDCKLIDSQKNTTIHVRHTSIMMNSANPTPRMPQSMHQDQFQ